MLDYIPTEIKMSISPILHEQVVNGQYWDTPLNVIAAEHLTTMTAEELDNDWRLGDFFGTIAVINLPQDTTRLERITKELNDIGTYDFEVFPAIDGRKELDPSLWMKIKHTRSGNETKDDKKSLDRLHQGEAGCYMSHYLLIKRTNEAFDTAILELQNALSLNDQFAVSNAKSRVKKFSRILILEDDNGFGIVNTKKTKSSKKNLGTLFRKALKTMPKTWDMLYMMCVAQEKTKVTSKYLRQIKRSAFANAYVVNFTMYKPILSILKQIEDPTVTEVLPVDKAISYKHYLYKVYAIYPSIAFQYNGMSSIDSSTTPTLTQFQPVHK